MDAPPAARSRNALASRCAVLVVAVVALLLSGCAAPDVTPVACEYQWGETPAPDGWKDVAALHTIPGYVHDGSLWLRVRPPPLDVPDPAVHFDRGWFLTEIRSGGRVVDPKGATPFVPYRPGDDVQVQWRTPTRLIAPVVIAGSQRSLWIAALRREGPPALVGGTLVLTGLLSLFAGLRRGADRSYRGLGIFLAPLGLTVLIKARTLAQINGVSGETALMLHEFGTFAFPFGFAEFVMATFGDGPWRILGRGIRLFAIVSVVLWGLHFAGVAYLGDTRAIVPLVMLVFLVQACILAYRATRTGDAAARAFLIGVSALLLISLPEILDGMRVLRLYVQTVPIGMLAFAAAMFAVIERRYRSARDGLAEQVVALEGKNREVQSLNVELRHQIAQRSRQLGELAHHGPASIPESRLVRDGEIIDGRYRIVRELGRGGMGSVHEIERLGDGKRLALKLMFGVGPNAAARFAREAEIAARVVDPHLVSVVDIGTLGPGQLYFVMELVQGRSLEEARASFGDAAWAIPILRQIARGLRAARGGRRAPRSQTGERALDG